MSFIEVTKASREHVVRRMREDLSKRFIMGSGSMRLVYPEV